MPPLIILAVGVVVTLLCLFFVYETVTGLRRAAERADRSDSPTSQRL